MRKSKKLLAKEYEIGVMANMLERYSSIEICFDYYNRIGYAITCDSLDDWINSNPATKKIFKQNWLKWNKKNIKSQIIERLKVLGLVYEVLPKPKNWNSVANILNFFIAFC